VNDRPTYVRTRYIGRSYNPTYEGIIVRFRGFNEGGLWDTLGTTRGHLTRAAAIAAAMRLADRRGIKVTDDPRAIRMIEFRARYGDQAADTDPEPD
jgi:hypothetical protein